MAIVNVPLSIVMTKYYGLKGLAFSIFIAYMIRNVALFYVFYSKTRNVYCIRANKQAAIKFLNLIKPYIIPEMQYKCSIKLQERETSLKDDDIV